jgi:2-C-methyl-D-erythritol 2,4-cyclodiphosphate synthase
VKSDMRIGMGYDVHPLAAGRPLVLGGVVIPFEKGLMGHSDADVLVHAACDALLGAAGLGDLGDHFPDTDPSYKDIYSIQLLRRCKAMIQERHFQVVNLDATIFAQAPKMAPHRSAMQKTMAAALDCAADQVNIKATSTEGLGNIGRGEGMAAMCVVLIENLKT